MNPVWVRLCADELAGLATRVVATVAGFPLGASRADVKANEAAQGIGDGAREIDMVLNVGALSAGDLRAVDLDVRAVADACGAMGALLKVIIEAALLSDRGEGRGLRDREARRRRLRQDLDRLRPGRRHGRGRRADALGRSARASA